MAEEGLKIPSGSKLQEMVETIGEEEYNWLRISIDKVETFFIIPTPTKTDKNKSVELDDFRGSVLVARPYKYTPPEKKDDPDFEPQDRVVLYILPVGSTTPRMLFLSPSSVRDWNEFVKNLHMDNKSYYSVLIDFRVERVKHKSKSWVWNKPKFKTVRGLNSAEREFVEEFRIPVLKKAAAYEGRATLTKFMENIYESDNKLIGLGKEEEPDFSRSVTASLDEEEETHKPKEVAAEPAPRTRKVKEEEPKPLGRPRKPKEEEDDAENFRNSSRQRKPKDEEEEEEETPNPFAEEA